MREKHPEEGRDVLSGTWRDSVGEQRDGAIRQTHGTATKIPPLDHKSCSGCIKEAARVKMHPSPDCLL